MKLPAAASLSLAFMGLAASSTNSPAQQVQKLAPPDSRPMLRAFSFSEVAAKGLPLYCIFMRTDGSQFASLMTLLSVASKPRGEIDRIKLRIESGSGDVRTGIFDGAVGGIPLMEQWTFDLGQDDGNDHENLSLSLVNQASLKLGIINYRASFVRQKEDMSFVAAVGFCYMRDAVEPIPRTAKQ